MQLEFTAVAGGVALVLGVEDPDGLVAVCDELAVAPGVWAALVVREWLLPHPATVAAASAAAAAAMATAAMLERRGSRESGGGCGEMVIEPSLSSRRAAVIGHKEAFAWTTRGAEATGPASRGVLPGARQLATVPQRATPKSLPLADDRAMPDPDNPSLVMARSLLRDVHPHVVAPLAAAADPRTLRATPEQSLRITDVAGLADRLRANLRTAIHLSPEVLDVVIATLLADGHLLIEDHPGVGKTQLARTIAGSLDSQVSRIQATVDLLPSDMVGATVWRPEVGNFEFRPGPVFAHVVLVDELNRATPKAQSGLLEAMQERQVTVDRETHRLPSPFLVIATQNPSAAYDGTYALPPAQLDRFLARVSLGYPSPEQEIALLSGAQSQVVPISSPCELQRAQHAVRGVRTAPALVRYVVALLAGTRKHPLAEVGASPRAGLLLIAAARAHAAIDGRDFVVPDDVQAIARPVLLHRLQFAATAPVDAAESVVADVLAAVPAR